ncbi:MAG TPA: ABC transporter ATP-binding protein [Tepidisphaeraceae bacterium]|jgi:putative ABC transport system ATP-binding protein|nr:ABC transporter ATP-binding protein [Tepidisphaeraceae bacterium]
MSPLVVEHAVKTFRQGDRSVDALRGISIEVPQGQFLAIMGASGSGKSTLLHLMAGLTTANAGKVLVNGTDLTTMNDKTLTLFRRKHIGLVFQSFNLIPTLSAEENVALPLMLNGRLTPAHKAKVEELMKALGIAGRRHHRPDAMSGGEQQRVAIGRALVTDPAVILADEPTGNLDSANSRGVCELLRDLSVIHNKTIVLVTHEPSVAAYAQEVAVIRDGNLVDRFSTEGLGSGQELAARYHEAMNNGVAASDRKDATFQDQ